jgi:Ca2+-binding RTX toxin-like protein
VNIIQFREARAGCRDLTADYPGLIAMRSALRYEDQRSESPAVIVCRIPVTNTDTIVVTGEPITDLYIDLAGGPFAPGATAEADGSSEIEIEVDFVNDQPSYSSLFIWGTGSRDSFVASEQGIDITGGLDADVFLSGRGPALTLIGSGGGDTLSARGGGGLGGPIGHVGFQGGSGPDRLLGGLAFEYLDGGNGNDRLAAGPGEDMAFGERGNDVIKGQGGDENRLLGGAGDDRVIGGPGVDICREGRGNRPTRCEVRFRDAFLD